LKFVIVISTGGGVLSKLLELTYFKERLLEVISDRQCGAIDIAIKHNIPYKIIPAKNGEEFSKNLLTTVDPNNVDIVISFYTKLFSGDFLKKWAGKLINNHPSILPACPGMNGFEDTIASGSKFIGATVHLVDDGIDTGAPIIQSVIPLDNSKNIDELRHIVFIHQCKILLQTIKWYEEGRIVIIDNKVTISNSQVDEGFFSPKLDFTEALNFSSNRSVLKLFDARSSTNHPISLIYSEIFDAIILNGSFEMGRSQPGFNLGITSPFLYAAKKAVEFGISKNGFIDVIEVELSNYYKKVQPCNAANWLGLEKDANELLMEAPPWGAVFPWRARTLESYQKTYEKAALEENLAIGINTGIEEGWLFCGPVSKQKCRIEAKRIGYVLTQISKQGYVRSDEPDGDVKATALVNNGEWRWLITAGNHRAVAAAALGYKSIPIRVNLVINRDDVDVWPRVIDGLYSKKQALNIFDNIFSGNVSHITKIWNKK